MTSRIQRLGRVGRQFLARLVAAVRWLAGDAPASRAAARREALRRLRQYEQMERDLDRITYHADGPAVGLGPQVLRRTPSHVFHIVAVNPGDAVDHLLASTSTVRPRLP